MRKKKLTLAFSILVVFLSMQFISADIQLDNLNVSFPDNVCYDDSFEVVIGTFNATGEFVEVSGFNNSLTTDENITDFYTKDSFYYSDEPSYRGYWTIENKSVDNFEIQITAIDETKEVSQSHEINVENCDGLFDNVTSFEQFFRNNAGVLLVILASILGIVAIFVFTWIYVQESKPKPNKFVKRRKN